ncbi:MFS transporter [Streptomyces antibioticus]|uniref:MFS transporter n=1 Tax=Streptomyces antibioticus TaxID=1890 RepID=UPI003D728297
MRAGAAGPRSSGGPPGCSCPRGRSSGTAASRRRCPSAGPRGTADRGRTLLLAAVAGTAIANNYVVQPALTDVADQLGVPSSVIGLVPTAALVGCTAGFALLLPLVDRVAPRRLIAGQLAVLAAALVLAASAPGAGVLLAAHLVVGATAGVGAQAGGIAGRRAPPGRRATAVDTVAAGTSVGILLSRLVGGALADALGWRRMLLVFTAQAANQSRVLALDPARGGSLSSVHLVL